MKAVVRSLAAALCLTVLAACSGGGEDAAEVIRAAPQKTIDAGSARVTINATVSSGGTSQSFGGDGVFDLGEGRGMFTVNLGAFGATLGAGTLEAVFAGGTIYVKLPASLTTAGKPWVRIDLASLSQQSGVDIGSLGQLRSIDPSQALRFLEGAVDDMKKVGEERVRGAETTHYRGTVDLRQASAALDGDAKAAVDQAIESLGTSTLPADVWIDDEGRMRKLSFETANTESGAQTTGRVELELYDFGVSVTAEPPPASQTTDFTSLFAGTPGRR